MDAPGVDAAARGGALMLRPFEGRMPRLHPSVFAAASAEIIGDVDIGRDSSVWFQAVIRGDVNSITIGERTNVQDGCVLHVRHGAAPLVIGSDVTLGHRVVAHACTIADHCLIGMGAILLDNAVINPYTLVAAGAVVRNNTVLPEGILAAGVPARIVRPLTAGERAMIDEAAASYLRIVQSYRVPHPSP